MYFNSILIRKIDWLSTFLEAFNNRSFPKGCYHWLKGSDENYVSIFKEKKVIKTSSVTYKGYAHIGIVLQGPVKKNDNFTINTVKLLRLWYPDIKIVLSTWRGELDDEDRFVLEENKCHVIESHGMEPENKGKGEKIGHLNNQILSSYVGVDYLSKLGVTFAMKVRSDIRIYKSDFVQYLLNLIDVFNNTKYKLVNVAFSNSLYNIPFHLSDFIWFGDISTLKKMYSVPYRDKECLSNIVEFMQSDNMDAYRKCFAEAKDRSFSLDISWYNDTLLDMNFLTNYHEEIYLPYQFWKMDGKSNANLMIDYYDFLSDIIIIDDNDLLIYWDKYLYSIVQSDYCEKDMKKLSHSKWLDIYLNWNRKN